MPSIEEVIREAAGRHHVDPELALAIARQESSLNPSAHNAGTAERPEDSWGLFQLNRQGGLGSGYSPEQLSDPGFNADIALSHLAATARAQPGLVGKPGELAQASQRSGDPDYAGKIARLMGGGMAGGDTNGDAAKPGVNAVLDAALQHQKEVRDQITYWEGKKGEVGPDGQPTLEAFQAGKRITELNRLMDSANRTVQMIARGSRMEIRNQPGVGVIGVDPITGAVTVLSSEAANVSAAAQRAAAQTAAGLWPAQAEHARAQAEHARAQVGLAGAQAEHAGAQAEEIRFKLARAQKVAQWADEARADLETALKSGDPDQMKSALDRYQEITEPDKALATLEARAEREIRASQERERTAMLVTRLGTAAEVGAAPGGPVRVGQSSGPNVPGAPDESLGLRVLHQMGLDVHPQTGMLTPRPRTPPATTVQPDQTGTTSADAALTTSQGPSTPGLETGGEQGSNLERLLNMTGMLQPQPSPEYAAAW